MNRLVNNSELKSIELNILSDVATFCDNNQICYFLVCGTALGAVRHNGFIPWDDDIDIGMPRPDYERFIHEYHSEKYYVISSRNNKQYPYAFAKVCDSNTELVERIENPCQLGVYIDIFPIDGLPDNRIELKKHLCRINWDLRLLSWKRISKKKKVGFFHKIIQIFAKTILLFIPVHTLVEKLEKDVKRYSYDECKNVGHLTTVATWGNDVKPKQVFENPIKHQFETCEFWLPGMYKEYLTLEYGDFMQIPPKEKQIAKHDFSAYWKE